MGLSLAKQLVSPQKMFVLNKVHYFDFLVFCLYTFNSLSLSLKWLMTLVATAYINMERGKSCGIANMIRVKGGQKGDHLFSFLDLILFCAIHIRQMKLSWKLRNEKKKFQISISKTLVEFY